jgi:hypothetical protein
MPVPRRQVALIVDGQPLPDGPEIFCLLSARAIALGDLPEAYAPKYGG